MSFTFLNPLFLLGLLTIPAVVLLHFIRLRKKRQDVSAMFLWKQALEITDTRRRFSPTWLLLLQLLFVTLASLALSQPSFSFQGPPDRIFIIDASASMTAKDSDGIRLEKAIKEAISLARQSGRVAIIRAGLDATVVQGLTGNTADITAALSSIKAADRETDMDRAISLALSIAPEADIHIFTDSEAPSGNQISLHPVTGDALNLGINTFDIGIQQAFVSVVSNHPRPQEVALELWQISGENETPVGQSTLLIPAMGQANVSFPLQTSGGFFEARLQAPDWDALSLDNSAFAGKRDLNIVLTAPDELLERALAAIPNISFQTLPNADLNAPGFDVRIVFEPVPETATGNFLQFAPVAQIPVYKLINSWDRSDPLLRFVDLNETVVGIDLDSSLSLNPDWQILAETSDLSPVIARLQTPEKSILLLNFNPSQSDMVNRSAFPLLMTNIMNSFRDEEKLVLGELLAEGAILERGASGQIVNQAKTIVDSPGIYLMNGEPFTASLLSAGESSLAVIETPETPPASTSGRSSERVRDIALWLIALATLFLLAEWLLWSRSKTAWAFRR